MYMIVWQLSFTGLLNVMTIQDQSKVLLSSADFFFNVNFSKKIFQESSVSNSVDPECWA